jgi:hypothetical protein
LNQWENADEPEELETEKTRRRKEKKQRKKLEKRMKKEEEKQSSQAQLTSKEAETKQLSKSEVGKIKHLKDEPKSEDIKQGESNPKRGSGQKSSGSVFEDSLFDHAYQDYQASKFRLEVCSIDGAKRTTNPSCRYMPFDGQRVLVTTKDRMLERFREFQEGEVERDAISNLGGETEEDNKVGLC